MIKIQTVPNEVERANEHISNHKFITPLKWDSPSAHMTPAAFPLEHVILG